MNSSNSVTASAHTSEVRDDLAAEGADHGVGSVSMEPPRNASLYRKLSQIAGEITGVTKDKVNSQLNYKYAGPAAVMSAVKPILAKYNVAVMPTMGDVLKEDIGTRTQSGAANILTRVVMSFLLLDGDTGESLVIPWMGEGLDWSDKGIAKAATIAVRTFLVNVFQIPSEDDDVDPDQGGGSYQGKQNGNNSNSSNGNSRGNSKGSQQKSNSTVIRQKKNDGPATASADANGASGEGSEEEVLEQLRAGLIVERKRLNLRSGADWINVLDVLTAGKYRSDAESVALVEWSKVLTTLQSFSDPGALSAYMDLHNVRDGSNTTANAAEENADVAEEALDEEAVYEARIAMAERIQGQINRLKIKDDVWKRLCWVVFGKATMEEASLAEMTSLVEDLGQCSGLGEVLKYIREFENRVKTAKAANPDGGYPDELF